METTLVPRIEMIRQNLGDLKVETWTDGERDRRPTIERACECGCQVENGVAYLSWSDANGNGFTVWLPNERAYAKALLALDAWYGQR